MKKRFEIAEKKKLTPIISQISIFAPLIASKAKAGQFIMLRVNETGERIPLTISGSKDDLVTIIYQIVGATTILLDKLDVGDCLYDFVGPLGIPTDVDGVKKVAVIGGGLGCAIALPIARALQDNGAEVDLIDGFRTKDIIILQEEMCEVCTNLYICTDDGSYGYKGFTTNKLQELIESGIEYDRVYAIGPLVMMKLICKITEKYNIPTIVSMNPLMVDGTGMCGCCRVTVNGEMKFACVDGPEFDGHQVDFDEVIARNATYKEYETEQKDHVCRLEAQING